MFQNNLPPSPSPKSPSQLTFLCSNQNATTNSMTANDETMNVIIWIHIFPLIKTTLRGF